MKIVEVLLSLVQGDIAGGVAHREPIGKPLDCFPEFRRGRGIGPATSKPRRLKQWFLRIETDEGPYGEFGPVPEGVALLVRDQLARYVKGRDPLDIATVHGMLVRGCAHARSGLLRHAIGVVDCALWDLRGRALNRPAADWDGKAVRRRVPVYAQLKGLSQHPEYLEKELREVLAEGYRALKVFLNHGPWDGAAGVEYNRRVVETVRAIVGPEVRIAVDAWQSWDYEFAAQMVRALTPLDMAWLEEPLPTDDFAGYAALRRLGGVPIAAGEHLGNPLEFRNFLSAGCVDIVQPDVVWCGGLTDFFAIVEVAQSFGVPVYPHVSWLHPTLHAAARVSEGVVPMMEYPFFPDQFDAVALLRQVPRAVGGEVELPDVPGLGMDPDTCRTAVASQPICA